jgi:outer membrane receptor protein involved in Fe transport
VPPNSAVLSNTSSVGNAINPLTYRGIRVGALYEFDHDWNALLTQTYQQLDAEGVFYVTPNGVNGETLPDLSVQLFNPSYNHDRFENTALTVNGRIGALKLIYAGSYLTHKSDQSVDYTNYARGVYADYYQCIPGPTPAAGVCYSPSTTWRDRMIDTHQTHELRLSTPDDWRLRAIGGVFWENYLVRDITDFYYKTAPGFKPLEPAPGSTTNDPSVRPNSDSFLIDITRGYTQRAAFTSVDYDLIPKTLTLTVGTRYYHFYNTEVGSSNNSFGCYVGVPTTTPCTTGSSTINLDSENLRSTYSGFRSRANLKWKIADDLMVYYTWSQGFRPGGFNRSATDHTLAGGYVYTTPLQFAPDSLTNSEFGWKLELLDRRLLLDGAVYQEDWKNVQVIFFDPQAGLGNLTFVANGPVYRIRGAELQSTMRVTHGLTLSGAVSWNSSNQTNSPYLIASKGPLAGQPITSIPNPYGPLNSPTSQSPPFQGNLRARYEWKVSDYNAFAQVGAQHQAHQYTATGYVQNFELSAFSTYNASIGFGKNAWQVEVFGDNLSDTRARMFESSYEWINAVTVNRPRTVNVGLKYKF